MFALPGQEEKAFHCLRGSQADALAGTTVGKEGVEVSPSCTHFKKYTFALSPNPDGGRRARAQTAENTTAHRAHQEFHPVLFVGGYNK